MATITLRSSDGQTCEVDVEIAKESGTIRTMLNDLGIEEADEEKEVFIIPINMLI